MSLEGDDLIQLQESKLYGHIDHTQAGQIIRRKFEDIVRCLLEVE